MNEEIYNDINDFKKKIGGARSDLTEYTLKFIEI